MALFALLYKTNVKSDYSHLKKNYKLRVQQFLLKLFTQNFAPLCIQVPIVTLVIQHHNFNQELIEPLIQFQDTGWDTNPTKKWRDQQNTPSSLQ